MYFLCGTKCIFIYYVEVNFGSLDERPSIFIRGKPIFSSERVLHKDYDYKCSVEKKNVSGRGSQAAWRQEKTDWL
jgi:hypothetical protein